MVPNFKRIKTGYPLENYFCIMIYICLSFAFQIIYYTFIQRLQYHLVFLFLAIELIIRYYSIVNFYFCGILNLISAVIIGIQYLINIRIFSGFITINEINYFTFLYITNLILSVYFSFVYEKYLELKLKCDLNENKNVILLDVIDNAEFAYIIASKEKVCFKNKFVMEMIKDFHLFEDMNSEKGSVLNNI